MTSVKKFLCFVSAKADSFACKIAMVFILPPLNRDAISRDAISRDAISRDAIEQACLCFMLTARSHRMFLVGA